MGNTIEVAWTIVPEDVDNGKVLQMSPSDIKEGFSKGEGGVNDDVDGNYRERRVYFSPLEVMLRAYLNRGRGSETEGDNGAVNRTVSELSFRPIGLEGP